MEEKLHLLTPILQQEKDIPCGEGFSCYSLSPGCLLIAAVMPLPLKNSMVQAMQEQVQLSPFLNLIDQHSHIRDASRLNQ